MKIVGFTFLLFSLFFPFAFKKTDDWNLASHMLSKLSHIDLYPMPHILTHRYTQTQTQRHTYTHTAILYPEKPWNCNPSASAFLAAVIPRYQTQLGFPLNDMSLNDKLSEIIGQKFESQRGKRACSSLPHRYCGALIQNQSLLSSGPLVN